MDKSVQADSVNQGANAQPVSLIAPLRQPIFRRIWTASLLSNLGQLIQGVGTAWMMTRLTNSAQMVALVQTALMLPLMLVSLPAGAIADMLDRRKVALVGLCFAGAMAAGLTALAWTGLITPWVLLGFSFLIGVGVALYNPAWQASVAEQVSREHLPSAIALGTISYNVARSLGPAIGGAIVAALGVVAAFAANALFYLPLIFAYLTWNRRHEPSRLPPERIDRAVISGVRYALYSPPIRTVLLRTLISGLSGASVAALTPLVARDLLGGEAATYGILLGAYGVGAILGAVLLGPARAHLPPEASARLYALINGLAIIVVGASHYLVLTCGMLLIAGAAWMLLVAQFNVTVQLSAPRWVTARALACYGCAITGGLAFGAWLWGAAAGELGTGQAMMLSGATFALSALLGLVLPLPGAPPEGIEMHEPGTFSVGLALTQRSGPILIEIDYRVDRHDARDFYLAMQKLRSVRLRSGTFGWNLSRDIGDPELWTEQYHCSTWGDYLRVRTRLTSGDLVIQQAADRYHKDDGTPRVRRKLERPTGSVRWRADTPDRQDEALGIYPV